MIIRLLTFVAAMCIASVAAAQNTFSTPASVCVPSDLTIRLDQHALGPASVQHAANKVGGLILFCPVPRFNNGTTDWNLRLLYQDTTGTSNAAYVRAYIYRMAIGTTTPVILAVANSDASGNASLNTISSAQFTHTFDFEANMYWVRIDLARTLTSQTVIAYSVVLDGTAI